MPGLNDDPNALGADLLLDGLRDLIRQALLNLQASRKHVHHAGDLAQAQDAPARQIRHMRPAEKRQQMMLTQTEKFYVLYYHHLVVMDAEGCAIQYRVHTLGVPAGQKLERLLVALRGLSKPLSIRVFAKHDNDFSHQVGNCLVLGVNCVAEDNLRQLWRCSLSSFPTRRQQRKPRGCAHDGSPLILISKQFCLSRTTCLVRTALLPGHSVRLVKESSSPHLLRLRPGIRPSHLDGHVRIPNANWFAIGKAAMIR